MGTKINQKEYLKKYLGGTDETKKKKKKKLRIGVKKVKIIDDDVDLNNMRPVGDEEFAILNNTEDAPQIVGVIDERGPANFSDRKKWKVIADDGEGNVAITSFENGNNSISQTRKSFLNKESKTKNIETNSDKTLIKRKHLDEDLSLLNKSRNENVDSVLDLPLKNKKSHRSRHNNDSGSDLSPPRELRKQSYKVSKSNKQYDSDTDLSQKSQRNHNKTSKNRSNLDSDLSSSRKELKKPQNRDWSDSDLSPPRESYRKSSELSKNNQGSDSDLSPPRQKYRKLIHSSRNNRESDSDLSPPREKHTKSIKSSRNNRGSDSDLSPPRTYEKLKKSRDPGLPHRSSRRSPKRVKNHYERLDSNSNTYRKSYKDSNRNAKSRGSDSDLSPPRHSRSDSSHSKHSSKFTDMSRHEKNKLSERQRSTSDRYRNRSRSPEDHRQLKKTLDGKTAGLQNAQDLREETIAYKKREAELFRQMDTETSGVGQAAVLRDKKTGKRRNLEAEAAEREEKEKRQKEIDEKYARWGKGLKQVDDRMEKLKDDLYEMSKPLARYADDADLDARLRAVEREGDPMLQYIKQKQIKEGKRQPDEPSYQGAFMPNRFSIKPGHRWDGVDRSNGYEKKWFEAQNAKTAIQEEAYKWSTSDM